MLSLKLAPEVLVRTEIGEPKPFKRPAQLQPVPLYGIRQDSALSRHPSFGCKDLIELKQTLHKSPLKLVGFGSFLQGSGFGMGSQSKLCEL